jgi:hypothetical protein
MPQRSDTNCKQLKLVLSDKGRGHRCKVCHGMSAERHTDKRTCPWGGFHEGLLRTRAELDKLKVRSVRARACLVLLLTAYVVLLRCV